MATTNGYLLAKAVLERHGWEFWSNETGNFDIFLHPDAPDHAIHVEIINPPDLRAEEQLPGYWLHHGPGGEALWNSGAAPKLGAWLKRFRPTMYREGVVE
jgi:hypothetical protein